VKKSISGAFQRAMEEALEGIDDILIYIDDILIGANTLEELVEKRIQVLRRLRERQLIINNEKSVYAQSSIKVLGYVIENNTVTCNAEKIKQIKNFGAIVSMKHI
jgi:GT2 family glycosyltransferase